MDNIECIRCLFGLHAMIIMIYVNCLYYLGYHIRNKQKENTGSETFAVCKNHSTRQMCQYLPCAIVSCARYIAHGKGRLCRSLVAVCALPCAAHGKGFAVGFRGFTVCPWHTANGGVSRSAFSSPTSTPRAVCVAPEGAAQNVRSTGSRFA